jgi:SH3 domain-containing YSC84-like protein 1
MLRIDLTIVRYIHLGSTARNTPTPMKTFFSILATLSLVLATANADEQGTVDNCASIVRDFRTLPEKSIPPSVLRHAKGLAIMSVVKAGIIFSGKGGKGVVVARTGHGWSGPSFIATGGAGWGAQIGAEVTDFVFVLNNNAAVRAFSRGGNITLGADASVAAGPMGRDAQVGVAPTAAIYSYSRSKGAFAGVAVEGAVLVTQKEENARYYGRPVSANDILNGRVPPPRGAAGLRAALGR